MGEHVELCAVWGVVSILGEWGAEGCHSVFCMRR